MFSRKQRLQFAPATTASCDVSIQLLFSGDSTSLCAHICETRPLYSLQPKSADEMKADCFKSLSYEVQKYEFLTNPSYLAGWPLGLTTMSIVGGQMNNIQPSCVVGQPLNQLTTSGHIQAERSCTPECSCVFYDRLSRNHVSLEITDVLIDASVISCQNSITVKSSTRQRARSCVRKNNCKTQREREPSRIPIKRLDKIFHSKCSSKRFRCAINRNFPKSSFIRKIVMNYKNYHMRYVSDNYYSIYVS